MLLSRYSGMCLVAIAAAVTGLASAQDYPNRPIRAITSLPGGGSDFAARLIAQAVAGPLGQPVIVENRPSNLTAEAAMKALPDGYTLLVEGSSFWVAPLLRKTQYEVLRDFSPITIALSAPNLLVMHPSVAANSVSELIALAKAKPGTLNYGSAGTGGSLHLAMEMFNSMAGTSIVHVPYKGLGPALTGLVAGEVQLLSSTAAGYAPFAKSGKLKALAVTSAKPTVLFPGLPTIASAVPGYELVQYTGLFAVGKPPKAIVNKLNQEMVRALNNSDIKERFLNAGVETVGNTPEEFAAIVSSEITRISKVIKDAGIKAE
jgi:tripartite-type tricarboxylate transporter receptor subunit TctC